MKKLIASMIAVVVMGATSYLAYPWALGQVKDRHPVGYVRHVESKLAKDVETMNEARFKLGAEVERLSSQNTKLATKAQHARTLANNFRIAYQTLEKSGDDAAVVHGCAYTKAQIFSQVDLLLAEAEGYEQSLEEIEATLAEGEKRMKQFAVQVGKTESQLAVLATKRELIRVQELTSEGEELLGQVDELMIENARAVACSPIRPSWEIEHDQEDEAANRKVVDYLAAEPDKASTASVAIHPGMPESEDGTEVESHPGTRFTIRKAEVKTRGIQVEPVSDTPIFKQSVTQK